MATAATAPAKNEPAAEKPEANGAGSAKAGFKAWLPLLVNIALMPALAYATFQFLMLPKLKASLAVHASGNPGNLASAGGDASKEKLTVPLGGKIIVNVAGTMGTRYLLASIAAVGTNEQFRELVEKHDAELRDAAAGVLSVKTINDLEKPGARNLVRTELLSVFNNVLGNGSVSDLYLTEFAIQ